MPVFETRTMKIVHNDTDELIAALKKAGLKAKVNGNKMTVKSGLLAPVKVNGTLTETKGKWSGSIELNGTIANLDVKMKKIKEALGK